ncbi:hypothetical protein GCM10018777_48160 [Streptomyces albogriseolus]|nr:hypothetical protein GCM10018777_48160 [Streptomyces viridodiastaticus]
MTAAAGCLGANARLPFGGCVTWLVNSPAVWGRSSRDCSCARPTRCPHPYTIRFRNGLGKQVEEGGFTTQDDAIERLTRVHEQIHSNTHRPAKLKHRKAGEFRAVPLPRSVPRCDGTP